MKHSSVIPLYKKFNRVHKINKHIVSNVVLEFNKRVNELILNGFEFKLPRLGYLSIVKFKQKLHLNEDGSINKNKLRVDWNATRKLRLKKFPGLSIKEINTQLKNNGEGHKYRVFHFNEHTEGYTCRYRWDKSTVTLCNKTMYKFAPTKHNRLTLAKTIFERGVKHFRVSVNKIV